MRRDSRGMGMPRMVAALNATGARSATAASVSSRHQPPQPMLSIGTLTSVQPISTPPAIALALTASHVANRWLAAPREKSRAENHKRKGDAAGRLQLPLRMVGNRLAPLEFRLTRGVVEQTPMAADHAFQRALPGLVIRPRSH